MKLFGHYYDEWQTKPVCEISSNYFFNGPMIYIHSETTAMRNHDWVWYYFKFKAAYHLKKQLWETTYPERRTATFGV